MLPPPALSLFESNPHFANLYTYLSTNILAPDGSTLSKHTEYDSIAAKLNEAHATAARDEIVLRALEEIASTNDQIIERPSRLPRKTVLTNRTEDTQGDARHQQNALERLPVELRALMLNIVPYLSTCRDSGAKDVLPTDTDELMADEIEKLYDSLPQISELLSQYLISTESSLAEAASALSLSPSTTTNETHRSRHHQLTRFLSDIPQPTTFLTAEALSRTLAVTHTSLSTLLTTHTTILSQLVRHLELQTHGTHSRHLTSHASYLSSVSRGIALKSTILKLDKERALYSNQALADRLESELDSLDAEERRLTRREREFERLLGEFEAAGQLVVGRAGVSASGSGEEVFKVLGERYREVEEEIEEVKRDIEKLEKKVWRDR